MCLSATEYPSHKRSPGHRPEVEITRSAQDVAGLPLWNGFVRLGIVHLLIGCAPYSSSSIVATGHLPAP